MNAGNVVKVVISFFFIKNYDRQEKPGKNWNISGNWSVSASICSCLFQGKLKERSPGGIDFSFISRVSDKFERRRLFEQAEFKSNRFQILYNIAFIYFYFLVISELFSIFTSLHTRKASKGHFLFTLTPFIYIYFIYV